MRRKGWFMVIMCMCWPGIWQQSHLVAQVHVALHPPPDTLMMGDTFSLRVELSLDNEAKAVLPDLERVFSGTDSQIFLYSVHPWDTIRGQLGYYLRARVVLQSLDTGLIALPVLSVAYSQAGHTEMASSDSAWLYVSHQSAWHPEEMAPPADIARIPPPSRGLVWLLAALALALLIYFLLRYLRRRKKQNAEALPVPAKTALPCPEKQAISHLDELNPVSDNDTTYYEAINQIIRDYLAARYHLAAYGDTPEELMARFDRHIIRKHAATIYELLHCAEYVRYGKGYTEVEYRQIVQSKTRRFLSEMKTHWGDCV
jgi:hypothetical protein